MKWVQLNSLRRCRCATAALPLLVSNGLATNEVGVLEFAALLPLRYRCLLQMD
jgi:hypothetical protein